jgi:hypothetical protein
MKLHELFENTSFRTELLFEDVLRQNLMEKVRWSAKMLHRYHNYRRDENNLFLDSKEGGGLQGHAKTKASPYLMVTSGVEGRDFSPSIIGRAQPQIMALIKKAGLEDNFKGVRSHSLNLRGIKTHDPRIAAFYAQKFVEKSLIDPDGFVQDLRKLSTNSSHVPEVGDISQIEKNLEIATSQRNIPQVINDEIAAMKKTLSPEQRKKAMANGFNQTDLRKQIADIFGKEVNQQKGIRKGRGFHHETDPNQIRNVIHHYFHQFL